MKRSDIGLAFLILLFLAIIGLNRPPSTFTENNISYVSKVDSNSFYIYQKGKWVKEFVKGVNMGDGIPGKFPGDMAITEDQYLSWFKEIGAMKANAIRVYTIQTPAFYNALYTYNQIAKKPLYLFQGVYVDANNIEKYGNAFDPHILNPFEKDTKKVIDVLHGNAKLPPKAGFASGTYNEDVSPYVVGYILGVEFDATFVNQTNAKNKNEIAYQGKYLHTQDASPFEVFLSKVGDFAINYETTTYKTQEPLSFVNWVTTDPLKHPNEPFALQEDSATINPEHIKTTSNFKPGFFASYHIYPYYPDSMNYQKNYINYKDKNGQIDTYKAYLDDLKKHQPNMPILVAEFGVPSSRGMAHVGKMGFNQGDLTEVQQGDMDAHMLQDIFDEGYAGGLVFSWQDEWFKRTWNSMDLDLPSRRPFWSNAQTSEQSFGLLAFDPGKTQSVSYVDGNVSEWKNDKPISSGQNIQVYAKSDEKYLYLMVHVKNLNLTNDKILIPIDSIQLQGNSTYDNIPLKRPSDFIIQIDGKDNSRVLVDAYYDSFYYSYAKELKFIPSNKAYEQKDSGIFNPEYLCLNKPIYLPQDKKSLPLSKYETGKLLYGNSNPNSPNYNSLADFIVKDDNIEMRIPWQLLNVQDPSTKTVMADLYNGGIRPLKVKGFYIGGILLNGGRVTESTDMNMYSWNGWDVPTYHERLKMSYYILKNTFARIS